MNSDDRKKELLQDIRDITGGALAALLRERDIVPTIGETNWETRTMNQSLIQLFEKRLLQAKIEIVSSVLVNCATKRGNKIGVNRDKVVGMLALLQIDRDMMMIERHNARR